MAASQHRVIPLVVACALFMENLDSTVLATSLPAIAESLGENPLHLNLAIVHLHGAIDHREPDPAAFGLGREIQVEDPRQVFGLDADTRIGKRDGDPAAAPLFQMAIDEVLGGVEDLGHAKSGGSQHRAHRPI